MCPSFLGIGPTKIDWCDLSLQSNIIFFAYFSNYFAIEDETTLWFFLKTNYSVFMFFFNVNCLLMFYMLSAWIVYWKLLMEPNISHPFFWPCWCKSCLSGSLRIKKTWDLPDSNNSWTWCSNGIQTWMKEKI